MTKKTSSKKSLEYVRPEPGKFTLKAFEGIEFRFRKVSIDDESWCEKEFGKSPYEIITGEKAQASDLCKLYFHFLEEDSKRHFHPMEVEETNYDTGEVKKTLLTGHRRFMKSIDGGSLTEMILIGHAFAETLLSSRPISDLPEDLKKTILKRAGKQELPEAPQSVMEGSEVKDLRPEKSQ